jgi:hypothetical protein
MHMGPVVTMHAGTTTSPAVAQFECGTSCNQESRARAIHFVPTCHRQACMMPAIMLKLIAVLARTARAQLRPCTLTPPTAWQDALSWHVTES